MFAEDARRAFQAVIGEIDAAGEQQKKTPWMAQAWHRRKTWLRWLRALQVYSADQHTMALARNREAEVLTARAEQAEAELVAIARELPPLVMGEDTAPGLSLAEQVALLRDERDKLREQAIIGRPGR